MVTIVTPTFNQGKFISDTFDSIKNEKELGTEIQYIVINANSTDNTEAVVDSYRDIIDIYINEKDNGQADALNKGFSLASGKYFNWLNSDDYYLPKTLSILESLSDEKYDIVSFLNLNSFEDGGIFNGWGGRGRSNWEKEYLDLFKGTIIFGQETTFVKTSFVKENNIRFLIDYKTTFDHLFYETILMHKPTILLVNFCGGVMRIHNESITINGKSRNDILKHEEKISKIIGKRGLFLKKLYHNKFTSWIFKFFLFFLKRKIELKFLKIYNIKKIDVCFNIGFNTKKENWKIQNIYKS